VTVTNNTTNFTALLGHGHADVALVSINVAPGLMSCEVQRVRSARWPASFSTEAAHRGTEMRAETVRTTPPLAQLKTRKRRK
jgi:hypothetical protein